MKFGFIGCGKMATALVQGMINGGLCSGEDIIACDISKESLETMAATCGVVPAATNAAVAADSETVLLCVKPADVPDALSVIHNELEGKLLLSIAAGVSIATLQEYAGPDVRVIRVMPNTPALVHKGSAAYALGVGTTEADAETAEAVFSSVGRAYEVAESLLDAVTGLSGSGPAYVYLAIEALADGGVRMGLPRDLAVQLAAQTVSGAAEMVLRTTLHPAQLKDMVASPGGTTIAGLAVLEAHSVRGAFIEAVEAATLRSRELGAS